MPEFRRLFNCDLKFCRDKHGWLMKPSGGTRTTGRSSLPAPMR
jgi:hypothetical protein